MPTMISEHFSHEEMACKHCGVAKVSCELMAALERLRARLGRPLPIVSGYRCARHNRDVGGAPRSQHCRGTAADLPVGRVAVSQAEAAGFTGIGTRRGWVTHVDVRPGPPARWTYD